MLSSFANFGEVIHAVLKSSSSVCCSEMFHVVFDSYNDFSIKNGERARCGNQTAIDLAGITEHIPIPHQMNKFWPSSLNKQNLQLLARQVAERDMKNVVLTGMVVNEELIPPKLKKGQSAEVDVSILNNWQEEADCRIISHVQWAVQQGCKKAVVISNDADTVVLLRYYVEMCKESGLQELWIQYGTGDRRRMLPLHLIHEKLGDAMCRILVNSHVITGDDALSKIGTKHSALVAKPLNFLCNFAELPYITNTDMSSAEKYLVHVWSGARSKPTAATFNQLRLEVHRKSVPGLHELPLTSSVTQDTLGEHIMWSIMPSICYVTTLLWSHVNVVG